MQKLLFFLILPIHLFSQNAIDEIRTDSDVVKFITTHGAKYKDSSWAHFFNNASFDIFGKRYIYRERFDADDRHFADSIMTRRWIMEDFTGEGVKDLVFYGRIGNEVGVYAFLNLADSSKQFIILTDVFANGYPHSIDLLKTNDQSLLALGSVVQPEWGAKYKSFRQRYFLNTLTYRFDWFVECGNDMDQGPLFDSIDYRSSSAWGGSDSWFMRIYKNGSITFVRNRFMLADERNYMYRIEKFTRKTDPGEWQSLLDYIHFATLRDTFELKNISDQITGTTTVWFSNGNKKTVRDYALRGTFGLQAFYQKMYDLSKAVNWQLVKKRASVHYEYDELW